MHASDLCTVRCLLAAALLFACSAFEVTNTRVIGSNGGVVRAGDIALVVPAGAFNVDVAVDLQLVDEVFLADLPSGYEVATPAAIIRPTELRSERPCVLFLPVEDSFASEPITLFRLDDQASGRWTTLGEFSIDERRIRAEISSFGVLLGGVRRDIVGLDSGVHDASTPDGTTPDTGLSDAGPADAPEDASPDGAWDSGSGDSGVWDGFTDVVDAALQHADVETDSR